MLRAETTAVWVAVGEAITLPSAGLAHCRGLGWHTAVGWAGRTAFSWPGRTLLARPANKGGKLSVEC